MRIYLDTCVLNRPFDDQTNNRVRIETEAISKILDRIREHSIDLAWSSAIDYENGRSPEGERRESVSQWRSFAMVEVSATESVGQNAKRLVEFGFGDVDAIHLASAIVGSADYFVTTDDGILRKRDRVSEIKVLDPIALMRLIEG
jgi:predicted nucleic acid-binding protein